MRATWQVSLLLALAPSIHSLVSENTCSTSFEECLALCVGICQGFNFIKDPTFNCPFANQSRCVLYGGTVDNSDETTKHTCWLKVRQESHYYVRPRYRFAPCQNSEP